MNASAAAPLTAFASKRNNELWHDVALLHAVEDRMQATQCMSGHDSIYQTLSLVQMARERIDEFANELSEYQ